MLSVYGLTPAMASAILEKQDRRCAICSELLLAGKFAVDHCHRTGAVRGFLCYQCNLGLGHFKDSYRSLIRAARYLKFPTNTSRAKTEIPHAARHPKPVGSEFDRCE